MVRLLVLWVRVPIFVILAKQQDRCGGGQDALPWWRPGKCRNSIGQAGSESGVRGRTGS